MREPMLRLEKIDKFYGRSGTSVHAVKGVNMTVNKSDIVALLGSSGCGKTSILRMIAGFETTSRGKIFLDERAIHALPPVKRNVAMAFEGYSLYPTVSVRDNIAFALKSTSLSNSQVEQKVRELADMLEITGILDQLPASVSGGQQQRASLARALIRDADLYLLDEPMGQLEPQLRTLIRGRVKHYIKERGQTAILVTHDQTEANALADIIAVMEDGQLQQYADPETIRQNPANLFTGTFVGEPPMNVFPAMVSQVDNNIRLNLSQDDLYLNYPRSAFPEAVRSRLLKLKHIMVGVRPYAVKRGNRGVDARVVTNQWLGDQTHIAANFAGRVIVLVEHERVHLAAGETIRVHFEPADLHVFDPGSGSAVSHGKEVVV